jgi:hypothetical protein
MAMAQMSSSNRAIRPALADTYAGQGGGCRTGERVTYVDFPARSNALRLCCAIELASIGVTEGAHEFQTLCRLLRSGEIPLRLGQNPASQYSVMGPFEILICLAAGLGA